MTGSSNDVALSIELLSNASRYVETLPLGQLSAFLFIWFCLVFLQGITPSRNTYNGPEEVVVQDSHPVPSLPCPAFLPSMSFSILKAIILLNPELPYAFLISETQHKVKQTQ